MYKDVNCTAIFLCLPYTLAGTLLLLPPEGNLPMEIVVVIGKSLLKNYE